MDPDIRQGLKAAMLGIAINACLAIAKIAAGFLGNSYALVADGIESTADILNGTY
jgi:divalent metal cation (Fe/Co/Zn/Cd) transporter